MAEEFRTPQSANEALLQNILGAENKIREPQSVIEYYLKEILEKGTGGENDLYVHNLEFNVRDASGEYSGSRFAATIVNRSSEKFTRQTLQEYLVNGGLVDTPKALAASGGLRSTVFPKYPTIIRSISCKSITSSNLAVNGTQSNDYGTSNTQHLIEMNTLNITDTVIKI